VDLQSRFWLLFLAGHAALALAVLLTQVPGPDRSLDCVFFSGAALLFAAAFWCELTPGKALPTSLGRMALRYWAVAMILLSAAGAVSAVTYRGL
jgi:hypothetical protein